MKTEKNTDIKIKFVPLEGIIWMLFLLLLAIICDICGCSWSNGFCLKIRHAFEEAQQEQIHPTKISINE